MITPSLRFGLAIVCLCAVASIPAGRLNPPGAPAPSTGPEPRMPVSVATTPGDAVALHVITQPGSYYLAGNITGEAGKHGIVIEAPNVTLDLMGFTLHGAPGSERGITVSSEAEHLRGIRILNGTVSGWGDRGILIDATDGAHLRDLVVAGNGREGIGGGGASLSLNAKAPLLISCSAVSNEISGFRLYTSQGVVMRNCVARANGNLGIHLGGDSSVVDCIARENGSWGLVAGRGSVVSRCIAGGNLGGGFNLGASSVVSECTATENSGEGISAPIAGTVLHCTAESNEGPGILVARQSRILENHCSANEAAGILVDNYGNHIEGNSATGNAVGIEVGREDNLIIRNTATRNDVNFSIIPGNAVGPIIDVASSEINLTNPYRNLEF